MNTTRLFSLTLVAAALAACASTPQSNAALDQARSRFNTAQADSRVATLAPEELKRASDSLRAAESARSGGASASSIDHLAYIYNPLIQLPALPNSLRSITCVSDSLSSLPTLPAMLTHIYCGLNPLSVLPTLPTHDQRYRVCR